MNFSKYFHPTPPLLLLDLCFALSHLFPGQTCSEETLHLCNSFYFAQEPSSKDKHEHESMHAHDLANMILQKICNYRRLDTFLRILSGLLLSRDSSSDLWVEFIVILVIIILASKVRDLVNLVRSFCLCDGIHINIFIQHSLNLLKHISIIFEHILYIVIILIFRFRNSLSVFLQSKMPVEKHESSLHLLAHLRQLYYSFRRFLLN